MEGTLLGGYQVLSGLGSGGMGEVYLAECTEPLAGLDQGTQVALKVIHPHLLGEPGFFKRFLREAQVGQRIQHENVVRTYDCDATEVEGKAAHFLVMEYVEGQTLRGLLKELERVPEELCRHVGLEVAKGLAAIHDVGVVHRDVKPENVLMTPEHVVKVMDLGVARLQDEVIRLSQAGTFVGSLEYAAPEQFRSSDGEPDGRADLHALGVMLYELGTGLHPYRAESASEVLHNILEAEPRKAGEVNPQLSPFFEDVVRTLLAKDPAQRFASATDLARVLEEGEDGAWWQERARAIRRETKSPLRRVRIPRETALYGRDDDLAQLRALYDKAAGGDGQVLLIEGEAGIGKTRLVDEFVGQLRQQGEDVHFLFGSYPPGGAATAAGAFSEAYREHFGAEGLQETLRDYLRPTPILVPAFAAILRGETTPTGAEALTKDSLQTVFVHATRGLAAERTTIVMIDDLHFAPADGRALFASLSLAVPGHRILLVGTMRPGVPEDWVADVERLDQATRNVLTRLGPKDLIHLLEDSFRSERLARELGAQIAVKCDGNPFFAFEIIRGLREGQFLSRQADGTWVTTQVIHDIQVPSTVMDLVHARVANISEEENDLLDVAACCGFEFDPLLVAEAAGIARITALKRFGQIEKRHRLVRSVGRKLTFDHHQVQEALYQGILEPLREEYHAAIARALEADTEGTPSGAVSVDLCDHYLRSTQPKEALAHLHAALDHLEEGFLNDGAIAMADRALDAPDVLTGVERLRILLRKNGRLDLLARGAAQEEVLREAAALADATGEAARVATVASARGILYVRTGRNADAQEQFERALEIARELGDRSIEARALGQLGVVQQALSRYGKARELIRRDLELSRELGDTQAEARATGNLGNTYYLTGRYTQARELYERTLSLSRDSGDRQVEMLVTGNVANVLHALGRYAEARELQERSLAMAMEIGDRLAEVRTTGNLASVAMALGDYGRALETTERSMALAREIGQPRFECNAALGLGALHMQLGNHDEAAPLLEASLDLARRLGSRREEAYATAGLARIAAEAGNEDAARRAGEAAREMCRDIGDESGAAECDMLLGELLWRGGDADGAAAAFRQAAETYRQGNAGQLTVALAFLACLPGGDAATAEAALQDAGPDGDAPGPRYYLWRATAKREHLEAAKRLLDGLVERAPEAYRTSMCENVRTNREILAAWASLESEGP